MNRWTWAIVPALLLTLVGCGGNSLSVPGEISGIVFDVDGNVVRGARVYLDDIETTSNSSGSYVLRGVTSQEVKIKAAITQDGISYYGEQYVPLFDGERSKNANITVVRNGQRATITGTVQTNNQDIVRGARIFAYAGAQNSIFAVTGTQGTFKISTLQGNVQYTLIASARGFNSAIGTITVQPGQTVDLLFTLASPEDAAFTPPQNVSATAWTSPGANGPLAAGSNSGDPYERIKQIIDPKRATRKSHRIVSKARGPLSTQFGNPIEVDLDWDSFSPDAAILGFNLYRRTGNANSIVASDFLDFSRDPVGIFFSDLDDALREGQTYTYAVSTVNVTYPNGTFSESSLSNLVRATPLGDLFLNSVSFAPLTFNWQGGSGATNYVVFVFDRYPGVGVDAMWQSGGTAGLSQVYSGPSLTSGRTYYYVVLGLANSNASRTISVIGSFVAP